MSHRQTTTDAWMSRIMMLTFGGIALALFGSVLVSESGGCWVPEVAMAGRIMMMIGLLFMLPAFIGLVCYGICSFFKTMVTGKID